MQKTYKNPIFDYVHSPDQDTANAVHHPVIIVGAGPCGLAAALDLAIQGIPAVVLDDNNTVSVGSRAICFSKRTLEILDRYGCAERMVRKGITWQQGKVFFKNEQVYDFNLLPEDNHKLPAFINLQQYYFEEYLVDRAGELAAIDLRWQHKVSNVITDDQGTQITINTQDGSYHLSCDYLLVADGANSNIRSQLGLESKGQLFQDRFLIADVVMKASFPTERWFWFDPPFNPGQSALLHRQADDVWRIDLQLGWDADPEEEKKEDNIRPRLQAMLGEEVEFELEWASVYTFQCRKMDNFVHHRVVFMGDAAHQVSPFGARGANGGIQSVENLAWKLRHILQGEAPPLLLGSYNGERQHGAQENILNSTRATDFISPKNAISRVFRDETLRLAKKYTFARALVNSGRLSVPCDYPDSALNTPDSDDFKSSLQPGTVCKDAPITQDAKPGWLLNLLGNHFACLINVDVNEDEKVALVMELNKVCDQTHLLKLVLVSRDQKLSNEFVDLLIFPFRDQDLKIAIDTQGIIQRRYDLLGGSAYLIRPDQVVCARWRHPSATGLNTAYRRALGFDLKLADTEVA